MMQFAYFYFMQNEPEKVRETGPEHAAYWQRQRLVGYQGGPFADRSGGLILFAAVDQDHAESLIAEDPFMVKNLLTSYWLKQWLVEV